MDKETKIEYITTVEYVVKVVASSYELSEYELQQIVHKSVEADFIRDSKFIYGECLSLTDDNKAYSYEYEAILPVKDK